MVYEATGSFALTGVPEAPSVARGMIMTGLLFKGGVFLPGLWLPQAHAEAETSVSALLSGVVVKIGLLPLLRLATLSPAMGSHIQILGLGSVFIGLGLAVFQRDYKRLLACSTISQVGFILIAPVAGAIYAFAHGVAKACLFLCAGSLPDRDLIRLKERGVGRATAWPMLLGALSISGCPLLAGGYAKYAVSGAVSGGIFWSTTLASIGTAAILTPLILLPHREGKWKGAFKWQGPVLLAVVLLLLGIVFGPYSIVGWLKALGLILAGYLLHRFGLKRLSTLQIPNGWERLEHVVGMACVMLLLVVMAEALL
jgi:multicomponent Na+:H+ antiporter subunit D